MRKVHAHDKIPATVQHEGAHETHIDHTCHNPSYVRGQTPTHV